MTVDEGVEFFGNIPKIKRKLETYRKSVLDISNSVKSSTTLSGGEAQRVKTCNGAFKEKYREDDLYS